MFGCENRTTVPIEITFNIGRIHNSLRSSSNAVIKKVIQPNQVEFLSNIRRADLSGPPLKLDFDFRHRETE